MTDHRFGGNWTADKLECVRKYLEAYMTIFSGNKRARNLTPIYVDAFAGTGYRTPASQLHLDWAPNIWMGVSVENRRVIHRIHDLQAVPAYVRFLSCEPLLGPLDDLPLDGIHWVIVGGESGPGARPMQAEWVRSILEQCRRAHVPFFFKQWGGVRKDLTGRELDGCTYDEMPLNGRQH